MKSPLKTILKLGLVESVGLFLLGSAALYGIELTVRLVVPMADPLRPVWMIGTKIFVVFSMWHLALVILYPRPLGFRDALQAWTSGPWKLIGWMLLTVAALTPGLLLLLPGLLLLCRWFLVPFLAVWQPALNWGEARRLSSAVMWAHRKFWILSLMVIFFSFGVAKMILPPRLEPLERPELDFAYWALEWAFVWGCSGLGRAIFSRAQELSEEASFSQASS